MAEICPVCKKEIAFNDKALLRGKPHHPKCIDDIGQKTDEQLEEEILLANKKQFEEWKESSKEEQEKRWEKQKQEQQKIEDKTVHVKSFDMPFGDMVIFMVKWALASIPAFIILALIGALFFALFGALFF